MSDPKNSFVKNLFAVGLLSVSLIAYQISLMQILSVIQWHHFAYMVISIAMLGFGVSGTILSLARQFLLRNYSLVMPLCILLSAFFMLSALYLSQHKTFAFDAYLIFTGQSGVLNLLFNYLLFVLPFLAGALAIGLSFVKYSSDIGKIYFFNLTGSGLGGLLIVILIWYFSPQQIPVVIALVCLSAGGMLIPMKAYALWILKLIIFICGVFAFVFPVKLNISEYKSLSYALNLPGSTIEFSTNSPYGYLQVIDAPALRFAPGLSLNYTGEIPVRKAIYNNGGWYGAIIPPIAKGSDDIHLLDATTMALPHVMDNRDAIAILEDKTGFFLSHAVSQSSILDIDFVEPDRVVIDLMKTKYAKLNDSMFFDPVVTIHPLEARTFLSRTNKKYDLIILPLIGAFGGTDGLFALTENYLFTLEAFENMWSALSDKGVIAVSTWMDYPYRYPLKMTALLYELLENRNIADPQNYIAAIRSWGMITFVLKKTPLSGNETGRIRSFCKNNGFDPLILPGIGLEERMHYNMLEDASLLNYIDNILTGNKDALYSEYAFNIRPPGDDKPFFDQFLKWQSINHIREIFGGRSAYFIELGYFIVVITLVQAIFLSVILIVLPLFYLGWKKKNRLFVLLYFSGLGVGYMFLEVVFIQQFIRFLGHPVYSASLVIGVMLVVSGIGSYCSGKLNFPAEYLKWFTLCIAVLIIIYGLLLEPVLNNFIELDMMARVLLAIMITAIPAFFMGFPFPLGIRCLAVESIEQIPWAWSINSCFSVISAVLAVVLAVEAGFSIVIYSAAGVYFMATLGTFIKKM